MEVEYDGKFTVTYTDDEGQSSAIRVTPQMGMFIRDAGFALLALKVIQEVAATALPNQPPS